MRRYLASWLMSRIVAGPARWQVKAENVRSFLILQIGVRSADRAPGNSADAIDRCPLCGPVWDSRAVEPLSQLPLP